MGSSAQRDSLRGRFHAIRSGKGGLRTTKKLFEKMYKNVRIVRVRDAKEPD